MNRKIRILFVRPSKSSFIQEDLKLLKKHFDVRAVDFVLSRRNLKDTLVTPFKMVLGVLWTDVTFSWFADTHAFWAVKLSKIFRKKSIVVVGGYEVAKVPEIGYGAMLNLRSARRVKSVLENADKILAVSEFNKKEILKYTNPKNIELVYNGVDHDKFKPKNEREDLVITAGNPTKNTCKLKGIDTFVKASLAFPEFRFVVIGNYDVDIHNRLKQIAPNVEFTGALSHEEVTSWLKKAKVYCQLSYRESFGMSLVEAMSCGCIPVISNRGALPEIVSNLGFIVDYGDVDGTIKAISNALNSSDKHEAVRERAKTFSIIERERDKKDSGEDDIVITVSGINKSTVKRKGMESFVKSARYLPHVHFVIIGSWLDDSIEYLKSIAPQNVEFTGFVSDEELVEWYQKAKVYCQLSLYESFGMALAESMCCECVPVVINNAALPEVVGDAGFYIPYGDPEATAEAINDALESGKGRAARERIKNMFPMERRGKKLIEIARRLASAEK